MKALVVDDIAVNVFLLETLLTVHGYEVATATNGLEALEQLKQAPVDLIISDILMPKMDGFQLCRAVKADEALRDLPFIFYTATYTTEKDKAFGLSLGACRFILKPADHEDFIQIIKEVLGTKGSVVCEPNTEDFKEDTEYLKEHQSRLIKKLGDKIIALEDSEVRSRNLIVELTEKQAEMERFTYTVSHDLKTPLVTIQCFVGQLELDLANEDHDNVKNDFDFIQGAANKMRELLDDLLQLSRSGRVISDPQPVALPVLVQGVAELFDRQFENLNLRITMPTDLPLVSGDPVRLREVFQNLLENAVKFSAGSPEPLIEVGGKVDENVVVCFVRDNGIGIPAKYHERVFGLFEKLDPTCEGTGIGLAIVRRVVEEHGGRVWVESAGEGCGSKFLFTLPVA